MFVNHIESDAEYKAALSSARVVVVDWFATWCGPCKQLSPKIDLMAKKYSSVRFYKADVDKLPASSEKNDISAMPTVVIYRNCVEVERVLGANDAKIEAAIQKHM